MATLRAESAEKAAYVAAAIESAEVLKKLVGRYPAGTFARVLIDASIAQQDGSVDRAIRLLERATAIAAAPQIAYAVELLAPLYVMTGRYDAASDLLDRVSEMNAPLAALRAVVLSALGDSEAPAAVEAAEKLLMSEDDPLTAARSLQRLALAAYHLHDHHAALAFSEASISWSHTIGAHRIMVTSYSIAYNVHHAVTGDIAEARRCAIQMTEAAEAAGSRSYLTVGLVAQYEIAAELMDMADMKRLKAAIRRHSIPEQYRERFACRLADYLPIAWSGDFEAFRAGVSVLTDASATSRPAKALCAALLALAAAALGDVAEARRQSRAALRSATMHPVGEPAFDRRYRRLARALAVSACRIIGDNARARRSATVKSLRSDVDHNAIVDAAAGDATGGRAPTRVAGYAEVVIAARRSAEVRGPSRLLTGAELEVLAALADGARPLEIALASSRSVRTIQAHTRSIFSKLDVHGVAAAVGRARTLGILS